MGDYRSSRQHGQRVVCHRNVPVGPQQPLAAGGAGRDGQRVSSVSRCKRLVQKAPSYSNPCGNLFIAMLAAQIVAV